MNTDKLAACKLHNGWYYTVLNSFTVESNQQSQLRHQTLTVTDCQQPNHSSQCQYNHKVIRNTQHQQMTYSIQHTHCDNLTSFTLMTVAMCDKLHSLCYVHAVNHYAVNCCILPAN